MKQLVVGSIVLLLVTLGWDERGVRAQVPAPQGELRIVDKNPGNWAWLTWNVFEHLMEIDANGKMVPGLATSWRWLDDRTLEVTLRQGVKFHNGEVFDAEIVKLNWDENTRLRQAHRIGTYLNFKPGRSSRLWIRRRSGSAFRNRTEGPWPSSPWCIWGTDSSTANSAGARRAGE